MLQKQLVQLDPRQQYTLTFYGVSRPGYPQGTLEITIDQQRIFEKKLSHTWTKYTVDVNTIWENTMLTFINRGYTFNSSLPFEYATTIACVSIEINEKNNIADMLSDYCRLKAKLDDIIAEFIR